MLSYFHQGESHAITPPVLVDSMEIDALPFPQSVNEITDMSYDDDDSVMSGSTKDSSHLNSTSYEEGISQDKPKSRRTIQKESLKKLQELHNEDAAARAKTSKFQTEVLSMMDGARKDKKERHDAKVAIQKARDEKREEREQKREERADRREKREDTKESLFPALSKPLSKPF